MCPGNMSSYIAPSNKLASPPLTPPPAAPGAIVHEQQCLFVLRLITVIRQGNDLLNIRHFVASPPPSSDS